MPMTQVSLFNLFIPKIAHEDKPKKDVMFHLVKEIKCCFGQSEPTFETIAG